MEEAAVGGDAGVMLLTMQPPSKRAMRMSLCKELKMTRVRDRNHKRRSKFPACATHRIRVRGEYSFNTAASIDASLMYDSKRIMSQTTMRELIQVALHSLFGDAGVGAFSWQLFRFNAACGEAELRVRTTDITGFRAALALLQGEDGARLHVIEQSRETAV